MSMGILSLWYNATLTTAAPCGDNVGKTLSDKSQKLQNRVITRSSYDIRSHSLRQEQVNWDDLQTRRKKHMSSVMY